MQESPGEFHSNRDGHSILLLGNRNFLLRRRFTYAHFPVTGGFSPLPGSYRLQRLCRHAFAGGPEAPQQREDGEGDDRQHADLAERVEGAKVDQDHVHHVGAVRLRLAAREERSGALVQAG